MNIREPRQFEAVRAERQAKRLNHTLKKRLKQFLVLLVALIFVATALTGRPLPKVSASADLPVVDVVQPALAWPVQGQAAIGLDAQGVLAQTDNQQPVPTASIAKVMLALAVLKKYPLTPGQQGPTLTLTQQDVDLYQKYLSIDGSVVKVTVGEHISEYQALQAVLLPSANNIADGLAIWAYGSMAAYHEAANGIAQSLGMTRTTFAGDASGYLPDTVSTAHDLVLLGQAALTQPTIRLIVGQETAQIPVAGDIQNVNFLLGANGNIGIKTGNSDQAGGCFLFASTRAAADGTKVTTIGAILGHANLTQALFASRGLTDSFYKSLTTRVVIAKDTVVARYRPRWGGSVPAVAIQDVRVLNFPGSKLRLNLNAASQVAGSVAGKPVGTVIVTTVFGKTEVPIVLARPLPAPTLWWRLHRGIFS